MLEISTVSDTQSGARIPPSEIATLFEVSIWVPVVNEDRHGLCDGIWDHMSSAFWWLNPVRFYFYIKYYTPKGGYSLTLYWVP